MAKRDRIVLHITEEIIATAKPRNSGHCLLADALRVAIPEARGIAVDLQTIRYSDPTTRRRFIHLTPAAGQRALVGWDQGFEPVVEKILVGRPVQVIPMRGPGPLTKDERSARASAAARARADRRQPLPAKGKTVAQYRVNRTRPVVLGGEAPPAAALSNRAGQRREFGLRRLRP